MSPKTTAIDHSASLPPSQAYIRVLASAWRARELPFQLVVQRLVAAR